MPLGLVIFVRRLYYYNRDGIFHSARLWAGRHWFDSRLGKIPFSLLHSVPTDSGSHPASYPMGTGVTLLHLVATSGMVELYLRSPLHDVVLI
jgi:hypothetical protein